MIKIEHTGVNVPDAHAMGAWLVEHLDMRMAPRGTDRFGVDFCFLADATGRVLVELLTNRSHPIPEYPEQHPMVLHLAFAVDDAEGVKDRLLAAGATLFEAYELRDGSRVVILRDPWGFPIQLCQRKNPL